MTLHVVPLGGPSVIGLRLKDGVIAVPALSSHVRPALVLAERETRELLASAGRNDVGLDGRFSAGPAGIQVWDGPFNGPSGTHGTASHLGSVDWSYDTPAKHYVTIYRVMVTQAGGVGSVIRVPSAVSPPRASTAVSTDRVVSPASTPAWVTMTR